MLHQTDCSTPTPPNQKLTALAFSREGKLLGRGEPDGEEIFFKLKPDQLRQARVFVLPDPDDGVQLESLTLEQVERLTTYEPRLRLTENGGLVLGTIPAAITDFWFWKRCCVRGRITNRASVEGQLETYPVCNAIVHVCEVDRVRYWIDLIPNDLLERLRRGLVERIPVPRPPFPDPPFTIRLPEIPGSIPRQPLAFDNNLRSLSFETTATASLPSRLSLDTDRLNLLRQEIQLQPAAGLRNLLTEEFLTLRPYLCLFPYIWPYLYRCDEVATVETDSNGRYEACFWHQETAPDVYLWIEYPFTTGTQTVYRPNIACHTRWEYDCSSDFDVQLSDNRIPPVCGVGLTGTSVAIRAIGHSVSPLNLQQQLSATIPVPGNPGFRTVGLTNYATSGLGGFSPLLVGQHVRPYTGNVPLLAQFGDGLPAVGIHYFQVQYRRTHSEVLNTLINPANPSTGWKTLNSGALSRQYVRPVGLDFQYGYYDLGPFTVGSQQAYRIPPFDPQLPGVDGVPPNTDPLARWSNYDRVRIGQIDTSSLDGQGLYEFRVRFLDGSGNPATVGPEFYRVPNPANALVTMAAPADYIRTIGGASSFLFRLRIDNTAPDFAIEGVSLDGDAEAMTDCGFVEYASPAQQVGLTFTASHPQDFGLFGFNLERGRRLATGNHFALGDASGMVSGDKAPYVLGPDGKYRASLPVADLLAGCGGKAAFSEYLSIVGLHTDGHNAGNIFRNAVSNSFALAPA